MVDITINKNMMNNKIVLISKDALCKAYLPVYGNKYNKMPNLMELAKKGTVFNRYYTAAPSSAMSYMSMFTGKHAYETNRKDYSPIQSKHNEIPNMCDEFASNGYECHILWDRRWYENAYMYSKCFGRDTKFHNLDIEQAVGCHNTKQPLLLPDEEKSRRCVQKIKEEIDSVVNSASQKIFIWIHLPHVLNGRTCYGADMDLFDEIIGYLRNVFGDNSIFISSDHGNMNGSRNKICYGFDVYEPAIAIPLITPRINDMTECDIPISNTRIKELLSGVIPEDEFVYSDCAYYAQDSRKLAIIHKNYKLIYNKAAKTEELYDLRFDPTEQCNIIKKIVVDVDRKINYALDQVYYYPYWDEAEKEYQILKSELNRIWVEGTWFENFVVKFKKKKFVKKILVFIVGLYKKLRKHK